METHQYVHMTKKLTLEELAEAAGVSIATVDRVVNQRGGVSAKAEKNVLEWANRLNLDRHLYRSYLSSIRVAVLIPSTINPFFSAMSDAFRALGGETNNTKINTFIHTIDSMDARKISRKLSDLATQYDAMVICCPDHQQVSDAIQKVAGLLPVVTLVTDLPKSGRIAYVGPDNRQIGRVAGEIMGRFLGESGGKVLMMLGYNRIAGHQEREMGFRLVLRERFPNVSILDVADSEEDSSRAAQIAQNALKHSPDIRGIYNVSAGNYEIAQTLIKLGRTTDVVFITHELTPKRREMLKRGILDAVIDQNPRMEARRAIDVLAHHFNRAQFAQITDDFIPFEIFLRENCPASM